MYSPYLSKYSQKYSNRSWDFLKYSTPVRTEISLPCKIEFWKMMSCLVKWSLILEKLKKFFQYKVLFRCMISNLANMVSFLRKLKILLCSGGKKQLSIFFWKVEKKLIWGIHYISRLPKTDDVKVTCIYYKGKVQTNFCKRVYFKGRDWRETDKFVIHYTGEIQNLESGEENHGNRKKGAVPFVRSAPSILEKEREKLKVK